MIFLTDIDEQPKRNDDTTIGIIWLSAALLALCIMAVWINGRPRENDSAHKARQAEFTQNK